jgi:hypothetical protein
MREFTVQETSRGNLDILHSLQGRSNGEKLTDLTEKGIEGSENRFGVR